MLDQAAINRLNQHPTSKEAEAEMKRLRPDWYLSVTPNDPISDLAIVGLMLALWEDEGEKTLDAPEVATRDWVEQVKLPEMSEEEIKTLLDQVDVTGSLTDVTDSIMDVLYGMESEKPEDEQMPIPNFWPVGD